MNLHQIVRSAISSVNPDQTIIIKKYIGMDNSGTYAVPQYAEPVEAIAQVQPLTSDDIKFLNSFNFCLQLSIFIKSVINKLIFFSLIYIMMIFNHYYLMKIEIN